jgi:twitching motility protein PilT
MVQTVKIKIDELLTKATEQRASDVHLTVGSPPIFRINGELRPFGDEKLMADDTFEVANAIIKKEAWVQFVDAGEFDFSYGVPGIARFRVNAFQQRGSISIAFRIIPTKIPSLEEMYLPEVLKRITTKPQGLFLVTGPTGSGKSTTLAAMINYINTTMKKHIITLEDPIEYLHYHQRSIIDQREVGTDTNSFANGLRASLRQDPDVILVGELRDLETISTAITASETGHLVLGTLHTTDAPSTIDRIIDVFPPSQQQQIRIQLASVLVAICSQRLFPTVDRTSRRAATEIMINNPAIGNLIRNEKIHQIPNLMQTSKAQGMHTLQMSMLELLRSGVVSKDVIDPYLEEMNY